MIKKLIFLALTLFLFINTQAQQASNFDRDWKFNLGDHMQASSANYDDSAWRTLDLPHDWSIEGEYDEKNPMGDRCGYLPAGKGWYRKTVAVPKAWKDKHVEILFDGVFMNSTVWLNGKELGTRPYGWVSFNYDISEEVAAEDTLTFAVRVDNSLQPAARWYTGSGIYGHTWISVKDKLHVAHDGIYVTTKGSQASFETEVVNTSRNKKKIILQTTVADNKGNVLARTSSQAVLSGETSQVISQNIQVEEAKKWSLESPNLYTLVSTIYSDNQLRSTSKTRFGFRDIDWKKETGFWLNGKNIKLHGVANHQDAGALGAAVPDKILRFRIQQLKDMGVNAIRTAHNPQTPQFYEICDELGMLVMDEIFDGWNKKANQDYGARFFESWWKQDLTSWIKRDRNHPSVIIYSIGNETRGEVGKDIVALCHDLDHTRPVTSGHASPQFMDVLGVNGHSEEKGFFDEFKSDKPFVATENTHTWQVRGYYRTQTWYRDGFPNPKRRPYPIPDLTQKEVFKHDWIADSLRSNQKQIFNSSYDNATVRLTSRQNIAQIRDIPYYSGSFRWTGHDYIGEAGYVHGGWPFKAFMGGAIDLANFEKDLYYLYQSQWTTKPMLHILPHWTHPKIEKGVEIPVWIYSNCDEVELFKDGVSLGRKQPGNDWDTMQCEWLVPWSPGTLKAIAYKDGKPTVEKILKTAGVPARLKLSIDGKPLKKSGKDIVQVRTAITDDQGEFYPYGENRVYYHLFGPAVLKALDNGSPVDVEKHYLAQDRIAFYGLTKAYVESTREKGTIGLLAASILGEKKQITSNLVSIDAQIIPLRGDIGKHTFEFYYTLDGTEPTTTSMKYSRPFTVNLGTTVKAIVLVDGKKVQSMTERFAMDEGFVWNEASENSTYQPGNQAESGKIQDGDVATTAGKYRGKGYVVFDKGSLGHLEWYQENDGSTGTMNLAIRYHSENQLPLGTDFNIVINGKPVDPDLANKHWENDEDFWQTLTVPVEIAAGANYIRIVALENDGFYIDEMQLN